MTGRKGPTCVSVINMKGGVGKTTIAALLGRYASTRLGLEVLAVDPDPQANLSQAFMGKSYRKFISDKLPSIVEIFNGYRPPTSVLDSPHPLDVDSITVGGTRLGGSRLHLIPSRFDFSDNLIESIKPDPRILARLISDCFQDKDIIFIDCAPTESIFTQAAYHASRYVLVPVKPEYFATIGFPLLNDSLSMFKSKNRGHLIDVTGIVINNSAYHYSGNQGGPERERSLSQIERDAERNGWSIFKNQIPLSRGFPKMMRGDFTYPGDALMFDHFAEEFFEEIEM